MGTQIYKTKTNLSILVEMDEMGVVEYYVMALPFKKKHI